MSDTPKTDAMMTALLWRTGETLIADVEFADFARELERENVALRNELASLKHQTQWECSCGGTDCEGMKENAALRADAERYRWIKRDSIGVHDVLELFMSYINCDLDKEIDQTRAKEAKP
jgi:hypothetical protein